MKKLFVFLYSVMGGLLIGIGAIAYLSIENKVVGAIFFSLGLFTIVTNGYNLFTGKVSYIFEREPAYLIDVVLIWLGNFVGTFICGSLALTTRIGPALAERAITMTETKLNDDLLSIFILAIFCNILIVVAVESYTRNPHEFGKYIGLAMAIAAFIICGYEHVVANMAYFTIARAWDNSIGAGNIWVYLLVMTLGNTVGGVIIPVCRQLKEKSEKAGG